MPVPAIVEPGVFEHAQRRRAENRRFSGRKTIDPTLLQGLGVCAECGYTMGRHSGSGGPGGRRHYYRCHGIDGWRRPQGAVCDNPPVRADALDTAVWNEVLALLEHPELIQSEIDRRLAAANETASHDRRIETLRAEARGIQAQMRRLLDAYQEGLVGLDELRERNGPLQTRQRTIRSELDALQTAQLDRESRLALATTVQRFLERMRDAARSLSIVERQRIVRLLVREVRIGKHSVTICHSIPLTRVPPAASGPQVFPRQRAEPAATGSMTETGGLLVPRCGQVVQQNVETRLEQRLPAVPKKREKRPLVRNQLVQTPVQRVGGRHAHRTGEPVPHGAALVPLAVQPPLAARIDQLVAHQRLQHVQPTSALAARAQPRRPKPIERAQRPKNQSNQAKTRSSLGNRRNHHLAAAIACGGDRQHHHGGAAFGAFLAPARPLGIPEVRVADDEAGYGVRIWRHTPRTTRVRTLPPRGVARRSGSPRSRRRTGSSPRPRAGRVV